MIKVAFYEKYKKEIDEYCNKNNIDLIQLFKQSFSFGKDGISFYKDCKFSGLGLLDETPMEVFLKITLDKNNKLNFFYNK